MILAPGAISMALTSRPRFHLPFNNEDALTGTVATVGDEGARDDKGPEKTSYDGGAEGSLVSSDKYVNITLFDFFRLHLSEIWVMQTS